MILRPARGRLHRGGGGDHRGAGGGVPVPFFPIGAAGALGNMLSLNGIWRVGAAVGPASGVAGHHSFVRAGAAEGRSEDGGVCVLRSGGVSALGGGEADYGVVAVGGGGAGPVEGIASSAGTGMTLSYRVSLVMRIEAPPRSLRRHSIRCRSLGLDSAPTLPFLHGCHCLPRNHDSELPRGPAEPRSHLGCAPTADPGLVGHPSVRLHALRFRTRRPGSVIGRPRARGPASQILSGHSIPGHYAIR